jgi:hypothetical protein
MSVIPSCLGIGRRILSLRIGQAKLVRLYLKNKVTIKRAGGMAEVLECLASMLKVLSSISSTTEGKKILSEWKRQI